MTDNIKQFAKRHWPIALIGVGVGIVTAVTGFIGLAIYLIGIMSGALVVYAINRYDE